MDIRDEFEKLGGIAETIKNGIYYDEKSNSYWSAVGASYVSLARINGAWYAFQEQQKKIDICEKLRDSQFDKLWNLTQAIEVARNGADEDFDLFLNHLSNILKGE